MQPSRGILSAVDILATISVLKRKDSENLILLKAFVGHYFILVHRTEGYVLTL